MFVRWGGSAGARDALVIGIICIIFALYRDSLVCTGSEVVLADDKVGGTQIEAVHILVFESDDSPQVPINTNRFQ